MATAFKPPGGGWSNNMQSRVHEEDKVKRTDVKVLILGLAACVAVCGAQVATIEFTGAEGYSNGDLGNHPDWTAMPANVVNTNADGYNGAKGILTYDPDTTYRDAVYNASSTLGPSDSLTTVSIFRFNSTGTGDTGVSYILHTHLYSDAWDTGANEIRLMFRRNKSTPDTFDIQTRGWDDGNVSNYKYSTTVAGSALGLSSGTGKSDWMRFTSTLTKGADAASWSATVKVENLTAGTTVIAEQTLAGITSQTAFYNAGSCYPGLTSGNTDAQLQLVADSREIDRLEFFSSNEGVNQPPSFGSDPIIKPSADIGVAYTNSIAGDASDPESDPMTFSKLTGPEWLQIAGDGAIIGTPASTNVGLNLFSIQVAATGGVDTAMLRITVNAPPPDPTGWEAFVARYGLSGNQQADADDDGQFDVIEFYHGGDPTNPAVLAALPTITYGSNDVVSFIGMEPAHTNPGIPAVAEWTDNLVSGIWHAAWSATNTAPAALPGYNEVERQVQGGADASLFFRNRLFPLPPPAGSRPNILLIQCDDLGYCDVGFNAAIYGEKPTSIVSPHTPNIDSLATAGMICTQAYTAHPFCGPSRMGLITGRYPHHFGGSKNLPYEVLDLPDAATRALGFEPANDLGIPTNEVTIATVLQDAGYHTGAIGKWHMGVAPNAHPNNRGFDYWFGFLGGGHNYYSETWIPKESASNDYQFWLTRNGDEIDSPDGLYLTDMLADDAVAFITNTPPSQPFFLYLNFNAPHTPHHAKAADLIALFGGDGNNDSYAPQQLITAMMYAVDRGISNIVATLTTEGMLDNTLVVFMSDNGGKLEDDADNGPLSGGKGNTTEGGIRTPMFIHYPGALASGSTYDHPIAMFDFYPTFAGLAQATIPAGKVLSGTDIWDDLLADRDANTNTMVWVRHNASGHQIGLRRGIYKAHRLNYGVWRLYNLSSDIGETSDISGANGALLNSMIHDGLLWSADGVDPLWHDTQDGYDNWISNGMPNYGASFSP